MNKVTGVITFAVLIAAIFWIVSCKKDEPTQPHSPEGPKPGKRDYVWTIDTLAYPGSFQTTMRDIWASAPNNVYVVGHNDQNRGQMYHYDGATWQPVHLAASDGGYIAGPFDLSGIYGFNANDIYAVGQHIAVNPHPPPNFLDSSLIIHFDGSYWTEMQLPQLGRQLIGVSAATSGSLWAGGVNGISYNRGGGIWRVVQADTSFWFADFGSDESGTYATAYYPRPGSHETDYLLRWADSSWVIADSFSLGLVLPHFGVYALDNIGGTLYSAGLGVFRKEGTAWVRILDSSPDGMIGLYGTRSDHLFGVGTSVSIYHFNGTDWHKYSEFENVGTGCRSVWCNESEVFVVAEDGNRTFIYHGR